LLRVVEGTKKQILKDCGKRSGVSQKRRGKKEKRESNENLWADNKGQIYARRESG